MISIQDIYQWYEGYPAMPYGLTPLQREEWMEQYIKAYADTCKRSFYQESLIASPALITNITKENIFAHAYYCADNKKNLEDRVDAVIIQDPVPILSYSNYVEVHYVILYDKSVFYETLRLIHSQTVVEVQGEIIKLTKGTKKMKKAIKTGGYNDSPIFYPDVEYSIPEYLIELKLTNVKVLNNYISPQKSRNDLQVKEAKEKIEREKEDLRRKEAKSRNSRALLGAIFGFVGGIVLFLVLGLVFILINLLNDSHLVTNPTLFCFVVIFSTAIAAIFGYHDKS